MRRRKEGARKAQGKRTNHHSQNDAFSMSHNGGFRISRCLVGISQEAAFQGLARKPAAWRPLTLISVSHLFVNYDTPMERKNAVLRHSQIDIL
jgi:hypothetical protein